VAFSIVEAPRDHEPGPSPKLAPIRQRIESIFEICKDLLTLERHGAGTVHGLAGPNQTGFVALTAAINLNYRLGRPPRALADYTA
jgi:hypothetical protein